jgi:hypothetical protein
VSLLKTVSPSEFTTRMGIEAVSFGLGSWAPATALERPTIWTLLSYTSSVAHFRLCLFKRGRIRLPSASVYKETNLCSLRKTTLSVMASQNPLRGNLG